MLTRRRVFGVLIAMLLGLAPLGAAQAQTVDEIIKRGKVDHRRQHDDADLRPDGQGRAARGL